MVCAGRGIWPTTGNNVADMLSGTSMPRSSLAGCVAGSVGSIISGLHLLVDNIQLQISAQLTVNASWAPLPHDWCVDGKQSGIIGGSSSHPVAAI